MMRFTLPPIYPITDKQLARADTHLEIVRELCRGGASLIQIRDKFTPARELLDDLLRCQEFAAAHNLTLLVDDRCDLALAAALAGVHLGQDDLPPAAARQLLGKNKIIGFSTHVPAQARQANALPVEYLGFGPIYATTTKANADPVTGLDRLARVCQDTSLPVVAIGGITLDTLPAVFQAGARSAAVISAILGAASIARQMELFLKTAAEISSTKISFIDQ